MNKAWIGRGWLRGGLLVSALAGCDGGTSSRGTDSTPRHAETLAGSCQVKPSASAPFEAEVKWAWTGSAVMPSHTNVMMTPVVVDTNGDGTPDVVFNSYSGDDYSLNGVLRAVDGATGQELWTVTDPAYRVRGAANIAAGDLDGDGRVELCTVPENGVGIICFEHDGTFKFRTSVPGNTWGGPSLADLDGDGTVEIINGSTVFSNTGARKWVGTDGAGGASAGPISFAVDLDGDGTLEVVNDRAIYRADGTLRCRNTSLSHGFAGVGNFNADPAGEVVVVGAGKVSLMDDNCQVLWSTDLPGGGLGGAPNIADFDNDGKPEIGVAGEQFYTVFETDGSVKWSSPVHDTSSGRTGSSTFDFDGDGRAEVVYADEDRLRIYDGATGAVRLELPHSSCTAYENPVVVDVDGDDNAEIVLAQNTSCGKGSFAGIRVLRDKHDGWVTTRRIWNQHAYSITNVNDDGTIPTHPLAPWKGGLNSFRSNTQGHGTTSAYAAPDLSLVSTVSSSCASGLALHTRVRNGGEAAASAGLQVAFYTGDPSSGGKPLGVVRLPGLLPPGAETEVSLPLAVEPGGRARVWAVADDDGTGRGRESECDEGNNASLPQQVPLTCTPPPVGWTRTAELAQPRQMHTATLLEDGRVLVVGGYTSTTELYESQKGTWSPTGDALGTHRGHTATRLQDGRVLVTGGGQCSTTGATAELYVPSMGRWRPAASLSQQRYHHAAVLLPGGQVLAVGGTSEESGGSALASAELYDPVTDTWTLTGPLGTARAQPTATLLPDGGVLVAGGVDDLGHVLASAERYDPATRTFTRVGDMTRGRAGFTATLLPDGGVLVAGGAGTDLLSGASAERYEPTTRGWSATGSMRLPRRWHTATLLPGGKVLVAGGYHEATGILTAAELYDPATGSWSDTVPMTADRYLHTATPLPDGTVLAVGGVSHQPSTSAEYYTPPG